MDLTRAQRRKVYKDKVRKKDTLNKIVKTAYRIQRKVTPKGRPTKPNMKIFKTDERNVFLSWDIKLSSKMERLSKFQLYACFQDASAIFKVEDPDWGHLVDVPPHPIPVLCKLSSFQPNYLYWFKLRAVDIHGRAGPFSDVRRLLCSTREQ